MDKWTKPQLECTDYISALAANTDSFIVGRSSGNVLKFSLPYIA